MSDRLIRSFWNGFDEDGALPPPFNYASSDKDPWLPPSLNGPEKEQKEDPWLPPKINAPRNSRQPQISLISGQNVTSLVDEPKTSPVTVAKETPRNSFMPATNINTEPLAQANNQPNHLPAINWQAQNQFRIIPYTPLNNPKHKLTQSVLESLEGGFYPDENQLIELGMSVKDTQRLMERMSNHTISNADAYNYIAVCANKAFNMTPILPQAHSLVNNHINQVPTVEKQNIYVTADGTPHSTYGPLPSIGPTIDERIENIISGAVRSGASSYANMGGVIIEGLGVLNTALRDSQIARLQNRIYNAQNQLNTATSQNERERLLKDIEADERWLSQITHLKEIESESNKKDAGEFYEKADRLRKSSESDISRAKEGAGPLGSFAVDVGVSAGELALDIIPGLITNVGALPFLALRVFGSSTQDARQGDADFQTQLIYGTGSTAISVLIEQIANISAPFEAAFGPGILNQAIAKAIEKMRWSTAGKVALSMISEGGEEFVEALFNPVLKRATYEKDAEFDLGDALYSAGIGSVMGLLGAGADIVAGRDFDNGFENDNDVIDNQTDGEYTNSSPTIYKESLSLRNHIVNAEASTSKNGGIRGAHNQENFYKAVETFGARIVDSVAASNIKGIKNIQYQLPLKDKAGNIIPGQYGQRIYKKLYMIPAL